LNWRRRAGRVGLYLIALSFLGIGPANLPLSLSVQSAHAQARNNQQDTEDSPPGSSKSGWKQSFDEVEIRRIEVSDLPTTADPGALTGLRTGSDDLPHPASQSELRQIAADLAPRVLRIVAVQTPPKPYRQVPMLYFGHAVWVSAPSDPIDGAKKFDAEQQARIEKVSENRKIVLISSLSWLRQADAVYAISADSDISPDGASPGSRHKADAEQVSRWSAQRRSLASLSAGHGGEEWLEEHRDALIALSPVRPDRHRNLVALTSDDSRLNAPATGLELFDISRRALFRLYGFSPYAGEFLTGVTILPKHPENPALAYYWQTNYAAILGAPLLSQDGKLVAINTTKHPEHDAIYLSIPTKAIGSYLSKFPASTGQTDTIKSDKNNSGEAKP
jgi:hypothetical protein